MVLLHAVPFMVKYFNGKEKEIGVYSASLFNDFTACCENIVLIIINVSQSKLSTDYAIMFTTPTTLWMNLNAVTLCCSLAIAFRGAVLDTVLLCDCVLHIISGHCIEDLRRSCDDYILWSSKLVTTCGSVFTMVLTITLINS